MGGSGAGPGPRAGGGTGAGPDAGMGPDRHSLRLLQPPCSGRPGPARRWRSAATRCHRASVHPLALTCGTCRSGECSWEANPAEELPGTLTRDGERVGVKGKLLQPLDSAFVPKGVPDKCTATCDVEPGALHLGG